MDISQIDKSEGIIKGDSISLEITLGEDITDWKIRGEIYDDDGNCIRLANTASGGDNSQIEVTNFTNGVFILKVEKDKTTCFNDKGYIEIEVENAETPPQQFTILQGIIKFKRQKIDWKSPS